MTEVAIEKGIPLPNKGGSKDGATRWPWRRLEVGDSFLVPRLNGESVFRTRARASSIVCFAKKKGVSLASRTTENGDARVWRVA